MEYACGVAVDYIKVVSRMHISVCAKLFQGLSVIRTDSPMSSVCPKYFLSDRKVFVKVEVKLTFTSPIFSLYFEINWFYLPV